MLGATGSDESSWTRVARHNQPGAMVLYALAVRVVKGQGTAVEKPAAARGQGQGQGDAGKLAAQWRRGRRRIGDLGPGQYSDRPAAHIRCDLRARQLYQDRQS